MLNTSSAPLSAPPAEADTEPIGSLANHLVWADDDPIRVLHIDDEPDFADMTATFLERTTPSITVVTETQSETGLARLRRDHAEIECLVSDYQMPRMDGLALLEEVRETHPDLPFILFTGRGSEAVASDAIASGVTEYMQKESGTDQYNVLGNRIENAVNQYRAEQAFATILSWYQRLCEQAVAGTYLIQDREFVYVNGKFAEVFGYEQAELIGADALTVVAETDHETVSNNIKKREQGDRDTIRYSFTGQRKGGEPIDIEAHGGVIEFKGDPAIMGILSELSD